MKEFQFIYPIVYSGQHYGDLLVSGFHRYDFTGISNIKAIGDANLLFFSIENEPYFKILEAAKAHVEKLLSGDQTMVLQVPHVPFPEVETPAN